MKLVLTARVRNGVLWSLVEQCGSQSELSRRLKIPITRLNGWLNFRNIPQRLDTPSMKALERRMVEQFGVTLDEAFPDELRAQRNSVGDLKIKTNVTAYAEVSISQLMASDRLQLPSVNLDAIDNRIDSDILREALEKGLSQLTPNENIVIRARYGLEPYDREHTHLEIGQKIIQRSIERVRQIEAKALAKLRHPSRSRHYKNFKED